MNRSQWLAWRWSTWVYVYIDLPNSVSNTFFRQPSVEVEALRPASALPLRPANPTLLYVWMQRQSLWTTDLHLLHKLQLKAEISRHFSEPSQIIAWSTSYPTMKEWSHTPNWRGGKSMQSLGAESVRITLVSIDWKEDWGWTRVERSREAAKNYRQTDRALVRTDWNRMGFLDRNHHKPTNFQAKIRNRRCQIRALFYPRSCMESQNFQDVFCQPCDRPSMLQDLGRQGPSCWTCRAMQRQGRRMPKQSTTSLKLWSVPDVKCSVQREKHCLPMARPIQLFF